MNDRPVLVTNSVSTDAAAELRTRIREALPGVDAVVAETPASTRERLSDAEVVLTSRFPTDLLEAAPNLRWIQALSAGVDGYDRDALAEAGVALTNASGVHAEPMGEQVLGYLLAFERGIHRGICQQHRGVWERYEGGELRGKTLGIVGVGAIGTRVAELGRALGMDVLGIKRTPEAVDAVGEMFGPEDLHEVLNRADYAVVSCPLTDETEGMIGRAELGTMGAESVLVNVGRGAIVDEDALERALQQGRIGGAALDVFEEEPLPAESPLWDLSNVIVTPHMAGSTPRYWERCASLFVENYRRYREDGVDALENRAV
jgi:phosphoglycerate dehydrogenase-like enzyme